MFENSEAGVTMVAMLDIRRKNKEGLYPIKIRVTYKRQRKYYSTGKYLSQAVGDLASIIAAKGSDLAEFQKALTLFQIGIDTARAISNITQGAAQAGMAAGPLAPIVAAVTSKLYYATQVASVLANIAKAKQLLSGEAPKAQFYSGGYTGDGGKYEPAGVVHRGEYVIPANLVKADPALITAIESRRLKGYSAGGLVQANPAYLAPPTIVSNGGGLSIDYNRLAAAIAKQPIYATVTDVKKGIENHDRTMRIANQ